jgi:hypothetical protein
MIVIETQDEEILWSNANGRIFTRDNEVVLSLTGFHRDSIVIGEYKDNARACEVVKEFSKKVNTRLGYKCDVTANNVFYSMPKE